MSVKAKFFANLRESVGKKELEIEAENIKNLLEVLIEDNEGLEEILFNDEGELQENLTIMVNGRPSNNMEGLDTELNDGDTVAIFPPVGGG